MKKKNHDLKNIKQTKDVKVNLQLTDKTHQIINYTLYQIYNKIIISYYCNILVDIST